MEQVHERPYKYLDIDAINNAEMEPVDAEPDEVLRDCLLDLLQLAEAEGLAEVEVDDVIDQVVSYRARLKRQRLRVVRGLADERGTEPDRR